MDKFVSFEIADKMFSSCEETVLYKYSKINVILCRIQKLTGFFTIKDELDAYGFKITCLLLSLGN